MIDDQVNEEHPEKRDHRSDRELDAAGDDDEGLGYRENAEQPYLVGGVGQVADQQEARIDQPDDRANHQDEDQQAEVFLLQARLA